jgi:HlyD family secretion protein
MLFANRNNPIVPFTKKVGFHMKAILCYFISANPHPQRNSEQSCSISHNFIIIQFYKMLVFSSSAFGTAVGLFFTTIKNKIMDRPISESVQRKQRGQQWLKGILVIALLGAALFFFRHLLKTDIDPTKFRIATLERGNMQNTITATGLVIPAFEQQVNAPIPTEIKSIFKKAGDEVKTGDVLLELDNAYIKLSYDSRNDQLELRKNNITRLQFEYDKNLNELDYDAQIKRLQVSSLEANLADVKRLKDIGGATQEEADRASLDLQIAKLEQKKLENELAFRKNVVTSDRRNLQLEVMIQEKEIAELAKKLKETKVTAPRNAVVTWINENIGQKVNEGEALAKLSNLESFRIEASCSDRYADLVKPGMPVRVRINKTNLPGTVLSILPAVANNTLEFVVQLEEDNHSELRPNMRVEVYIISSEKENVLRVANGPGFTGAVQQDIYVIRGEQAQKEKIEVGLSNVDFVELLNTSLKDHLDVIDLKK